jgi:hypothetical protein
MLKKPGTFDREDRLTSFDASKIVIRHSIFIALQEMQLPFHSSIADRKGTAGFCRETHLLVQYG